MPKSKEPKTHFEQIPLEIVKKIAKEDIPDDEGNGPDVTVEPQVVRANGKGKPTLGAANEKTQPIDWKPFLPESRAGKPF